MSEHNRDPLDRALARLQRDVQPERDLWSRVRAGIEAENARPWLVERSPRSSMRWYQVAAAVLLVVGSSFTTYMLTRPPEIDRTAVAYEELPAPTLTAMPASFAGQTLGASYANARSGLDEIFQQRLATLPPAAREKVERSLADLRLAAQQISETLAQHPSDPLLQELLMSTYQSEVRLLNDVSRMTPADATRADL